MSDFAHDVAGIGTLSDPVRRELYLYVCSQPEPVGRDRAAEAIGVPHHQAKFHLDKLEAEGLLETTYARLTGRTGPGAGRPAKLYRRSAAEIAVSLPRREYELAGELLAGTVAEAARTGEPVLDVLHRAASRRGAELGRCAAAERGARDEANPDALGVALRALARHGYEPRRHGDTAVMANCPFHALAQTHTALICGMNHALVAAFADGVAPGELEATLVSRAGHCCVTLALSPA